MPRPPQASAKGQQGAPEIGVSDAEMIQFYQQALANCQYQAGRSSMLVEKLRAALAERDAKIAELEAENAALKGSASAPRDVVSFEVTAGEELPWRKEVNGLGKTG